MSLFYTSGCPSLDFSFPNPEEVLFLNDRRNTNRVLGNARDSLLVLGPVKDLSVLRRSPRDILSRGLLFGLSHVQDIISIYPVGGDYLKWMCGRIKDNNDYFREEFESKEGIPLEDVGAWLRFLVNKTKK